MKRKSVVIAVGGVDLWKSPEYTKKTGPFTGKSMCKRATKREENRRVINTPERIPILFTSYPLTFNILMWIINRG
ncbi:MAG: hypothetical protein SPD93_07530 [Lachnospiraceae bacterium]|nr:hypothetical protein [Lachnospiraceae bacterium]